jgi:hypothetical protein
MKNSKKVIIILIIMTFLTFCTNIGEVILRKKWKLEEYDNWYLIVEEGNPVGYINYELERYYTPNEEQRYEEDTTRVIYYTDKEGKSAQMITRSWIKTDGDLNLLQFQFYSSPMYEDDKERFNRGIIEKDKLKISSNGNLIEIEAKEPIPSILNYRYIIANMERKEKGEHQDYEFFSLRYLTTIKESIVYAGEKSVEYKDEWFLTDKFLIMPFNRTESMDSYYFTKAGTLLMATLFQGDMYYQLSDLSEIKDLFRF